MRSETKLTSVKIISDLYKKFRSVALNEEFTLQKLVNRSILLYIEDEDKLIDIPKENINLDTSSIPACLSLHDIDVIVRIRTLKEKK